MDIFNKAKAFVRATVVGAGTAIITTIREKSIKEGVKAGIKAGNDYYETQLGRKEVKIIEHKRTGKPVDPNNDWENKIKEQEELERKELLRRQRLEDEAARKVLLAKRQTMIDSFQESIAATAEIFETNARRKYEETYISLLQSLEEIMDVKPVKDYIIEKSKCFKHGMRDAINRKINLGNHEMTRIMDDDNLSLDAYEDALNKYVDTIFDDERHKLLDHIQKYVDETNLFIKNYTHNFLNSELDLIKTQNNKLKALSKDGVEKEAELRNIAEQISTLLMVNHVASKYND